jgi:exosortase
MSDKDNSQPVESPVFEESGSSAAPNNEQEPGGLSEFLENVQAIVKTPGFIMGALVVFAIIFAFFPFLKTLPDLWLNMDSYYAHGLLVPLCSLYLLYAWRHKLKAAEPKPQWWAVIPLLALLWIAVIASRTIMPFILSLTFVATLMTAVLFIAGWRWMWLTAPAILFISLGLPIFDRVIAGTTLPLQLMSTDVAYFLLDTTGFDPWRSQPTIIMLPQWELFVAEACSGLKTTIAVSACVVFFMLIANLKWYANVILATVAIPLSIVINGVRIYMIGVVGNEVSPDAGMQFHDYSGYIALALCFLVLAKLTRVLGYK